MAEMKIVSFKEDEFDMEKIKREADFYTKAIAQEKKVRRNYKIAKYIIIISLFIAGYCLYYLASDLIARYDYSKYHNTDYLSSLTYENNSISTAPSIISITLEYI